MTNVLFCWLDISGYMAACWHALNERPNVEVFVLAAQTQTQAVFDDQLMDGIPFRLLDREEREDQALINRIVAAQSPDVTVLCGWMHAPYRRLTAADTLAESALVMGMDTPWQGTVKQHVGRYLLRPYVRRMDRVAVTGERSWQYARRLGVPGDKIIRGIYGIDYATWAATYEQRLQGGWPKQFVFAGRYAEEKGVDVLVRAYRKYRVETSDPWPLVCCGKGPMEHLLNGEPGIENRGFVQPAEVQTIFEESAALVLPSRFDPWPLVVVESSAAGLPVICTDACGSAVELVRSHYNGVVVPDRDAAALARAFGDVHDNHDRLPDWGERAQQFAAPHAAERWADRWHALTRTLA
jgi:glycosyltransferase involved in cell wall biosynthesis